MKIGCHIDPKTALEARSNLAGHRLIEIDPATWTPEEALQLALMTREVRDFDHFKGADLILLSPSYGDPDATVRRAFVDPSPEGLRKLVVDCLAARLARDEKEKAEKAAKAEKLRSEALEALQSRGMTQGSSSYIQNLQNSKGKEFPVYYYPVSMKFPYDARHAENCQDIVESPEFKTWEAEVKAENDRRIAEALATTRNRIDAEEAKEAAELAEMSVWVEAHGSERLKRCLAEGIEFGGAYRDERLSLERPGWSWDADTQGKDSDPYQPDVDDFRLLDECRDVDPRCELRYWKIEEDDNGFETWDGFVVTSVFLGRKIVYGVPPEYVASN